MGGGGRFPACAFNVDIVWVWDALGGHADDESVRKSLLAGIPYGLDCCIDFRFVQAREGAKKDPDDKRKNPLV